MKLISMIPKVVVPRDANGVGHAAVQADATDYYDYVQVLDREPTPVFHRNPRTVEVRLKTSSGTMAEPDPALRHFVEALMTFPKPPRLGAWDDSVLFGPRNPEILLIGGHVFPPQLPDVTWAKHTLIQVEEAHRRTNLSQRYFARDRAALMALIEDFRQPTERGPTSEQRTAQWRLRGRPPSAYPLTAAGIEAWGVDRRQALPSMRDAAVALHRRFVSPVLRLSLTASQYAHDLSLTVEVDAIIARAVIGGARADAPVSPITGEKLAAEQTWQMIDQMLGNELAVQADPPIAITDDLRRDAAGFDDRSFKQDSPGNRKARRAARRREGT